MYQNDVNLKIFVLTASEYYVKITPYSSLMGRLALHGRFREQPVGEKLRWRQSERHPGEAHRNGSRLRWVRPLQRRTGNCS